MNTQHNVPLKFVTETGEIKLAPEGFLRLFRAAQTAQTSTGGERRAAITKVLTFDGYTPTPVQVKTLELIVTPDPDTNRSDFDALLTLRADDLIISADGAAIAFTSDGGWRIPSRPAVHKTPVAPDGTTGQSGSPSNEGKLASSFKGVDWDEDATETSGLTEAESIIVNNLIRKITEFESELNRGMNPLAVFISDIFGIFTSEIWPEAEAFGKLPAVKRHIAKVKVITMCRWFNLLPFPEHFV